MTPGTYLRKRREAAGISLDAAALTLSVDFESNRPKGIVYQADIVTFFGRLCAAENDADNLTVAQAAMLRRVYSFDMAVYEALLLRHYGCAVPIPQVCRECACSWNDPCHQPEHGPCAWSDHDPELCTGCERRHAGEWPDAPLPEGAAHA